MTPLDFYFCGLLYILAGCLSAVFWLDCDDPAEFPQAILHAIFWPFVLLTTVILLLKKHY